MGNEYFLNTKGAKVYIDSTKQPKLEIRKDRRNIFNVLSVGFNRDRKPLVTIKDGNGIICYLLPDELIDWSQECVRLAMEGHNFFPTNVEFGYRENGCIWVEIL